MQSATPAAVAYSTHAAPDHAVATSAVVSSSLHKLTATPLNFPITVSSVPSYSFSSALSCLCSCWRVWFSSTRWDAKASSSVWNSSAGQLDLREGSPSEMSRLKRRRGKPEPTWTAWPLTLSARDCSWVTRARLLASCSAVSFGIWGGNVPDSSFTSSHTFMSSMLEVCPFL